MIESLSIAVHAFVSRVSMSFSVDETLLPWYIFLLKKSSCVLIIACIYCYDYEHSTTWYPGDFWVACYSSSQMASVYSVYSTISGSVWFVGFYGISTFVGYLTPNSFLCKYSVLFKTIQFSISTQFNGQKHFYFKPFKQLYVTIQLSVNTVLMPKNSFISNNSVKHKNVV